MKARTNVHESSAGLVPVRSSRPAAQSRVRRFQIRRDPSQIPADESRVLAARGRRPAIELLLVHPHLQSSVEAQRALSADLRRERHDPEPRGLNAPAKRECLLSRCAGCPYAPPGSHSARRLNPDHPVGLPDVGQLGRRFPSRPRGHARAATARRSTGARPPLARIRDRSSAVGPHDSLSGVRQAECMADLMHDQPAELLGDETRPRRTQLPAGFEADDGALRDRDAT